MIKEERQFLFGKYIKKGLTYDQADKKVNETDKYLKRKVEKWKKKNLSDKDIDLKFKEEFSKICERN